MEEGWAWGELSLRRGGRVLEVQVRGRALEAALPFESEMGKDG